MKVYCVQPDLAWHDAAANRATVEAMIRQAEPDAGSLVVLPETFASGFTSDVAAGTDSPDGETAAWLAASAREIGCTLVGGVITTAADGRGENVAVVASPAGEVGRYAKRHCLPIGGESRHFNPGRGHLSFDCAGLRVAVLVCYDLRFPEDFRASAGADLFVVIANWPAQRQHHWHALLRARAVENQAFVAGVNRVGRDPAVRYAGGSVVYDFDGQALLELQDRPAVAGVTLDVDALRHYRHKLPFLADYLADRAGQ